ncbi:MAG: hypothetical protein ACE5D3_01155 [Candidatus Binatia bacterium]
MTDSATERRWALERFINGVDELETVLGEGAGPAVERVKGELLGAMAARDRGDREASLGSIARAMDELARLGDGLGGSEGDLMRRLSTALLSGLDAGDREIVELNLGRIEARAGLRKKRDD